MNNAHIAKCMSCYGGSYTEWLDTPLSVVLQMGTLADKERGERMLAELLTHVASNQRMLDETGYRNHMEQIERLIQPVKPFRGYNEARVKASIYGLA